MDKHSKNYALLGIMPGDTWQILRDCYKSAIRKWHPDRFTENNSERCLAEEKTKEINRAFRELQEYYLEYGSLPLDDSQLVAPRPDKIVTPPPPPPHQTHTAASPAEPPTPNTVSNNARTQGTGNRLRFSLALMGLLLAGYLLFFSEMDESPVDNRLPDSSIAELDTRPDQPPQKAATRNFTIGSSLGEVHSVQGIPTRVDGEVWYYGEAKVIFKNGKVSHWVDSPDQRLLVKSSHDSQYVGAAVRYFDRGSTKAEVRDLQGVPIRETDKVWHYGLSRVYFNKDKVVDWTESPLDPLHIKR